jgi:3'5'-cyclic nucleotide phosphodiesterase
MSVIKLMSRIVAPSHLDDDAKKSLHDHTYGITSDPLTQFACAFSALIHDADHEGVSNAQLVKEGVPIAKKYKERSVAEQNSLDLSWDLLMQDTYTDLRAFLFASKEDLIRFRQLVVNVRIWQSLMTKLAVRFVDFSNTSSCAVSFIL